MTEIVRDANDLNTFVWIDMEDHVTTDTTLTLYRDLAEQYEGGIGVCLQANLKRIPEDIECLASVPGKIRLVKGAYDEPKDIAYQSKESVNDAYQIC